MGRGKFGFPMPTAKNRFQILNLLPKKHELKKKHGLKPKNYPDFSYFIPISPLFQIFSPFFSLTICLILGFSPTLNPPIPHGSPLLFSIKNRISDPDRQKPISDS